MAKVMKKTWTVECVVAVSAVVAVGCNAAADESGEAPTADLNGVEEQGTVYSTNTDGTWSATAHAMSEVNFIEAWATFTGPAGKTRKMGVCALRQHLPAVSCTSVSNCLNYPYPDSPNPNDPAEMSNGGYRYCARPNEPTTGTKYCFYRPGPGPTWCAGSPDTGGPIAPGTYSTGTQYAGAGTKWIGYGCFEGCMTGTGPTTTTLVTSVSGCVSCGPK